MVQFLSAGVAWGGLIVTHTDQLSLDRLEVGKLYFKIVNFQSAIESLDHGLKAAREAQDWKQFCKYMPLLLRIYAERLEFSTIAALKEELNQLNQTGKLEIDSATSYVLGIAASYFGNVEVAARHFVEAKVLAKTPLEDMQARFGLAAVESIQKNYSAMVPMLQNLQADLRLTLYTDLKLATTLLLAVSYRELNMIDQALQLLGPMQEVCKTEQNLYMSLNFLFCYGTLYQKLGEKERAKHYYQMVETLLVPRDLRHLSSQVEKRLAEMSLPDDTRPTMRLIENEVRELVTPQGSHVNFGNQFILVALLKLLAGAPGVKIGKEEMTRQLWKEEYNPMIHDNKIYVTIRRLRKMIEPNARVPSYILKLEDGYSFNSRVAFKIQA